MCDAATTTHGVTPDFSLEGNDKAKSEMVKCLELSMGANDKKVKLLDLMVKLAMHRDKLFPKSAKGESLEDLKFEDFTNVVK